MKTLVIVESPAKAKTIAKFLGRGFSVESSYGHIRDLPKSKMGIDIEHGTFLPSYLIPKEKAAQVKKLKDLAKKADKIIFATDEDREGEAISWHLAETLGVKPAEADRIVFHEITKGAIEKALENPRHIDQKLVDAQQARRVLDRLVGYELSPFLWKKVVRGLSAGRVQSVAVRLVVEREREIQAFKPEEYWTIDGEFAITKHPVIPASLVAIDGQKLQKVSITSQTEAEKIYNGAKAASYTVSDVTKKEASRVPPPPFTTSTLQQTANQRLGYSAKQIMRLAQQLYEGVSIGAEGSVGLITYMRTDSVNLSEKFTTDANDFVHKSFGKEFALTKPRSYTTKSKGAQEAHEAIRPTEAMRTPESIAAYLDPQQLKLYTLIWQRAVATQMAAAKLDRTTIELTGDIYTFRATGQTVIFPGWLKLYPDMGKETILPEVKTADPATLEELKKEQHFTEPPARYSDATLVKAMEEFGIGRPSTYAPTIATIEDRGYVVRDEHKRFGPSDIALVVNDLLVEHFSDIVDFQFTAKMEENLDEIAAGTKDWQPIIATFYEPFHANLVNKTETLVKKDIVEEATDEKCPKCSEPMVIKIGRFGKFLACSKYPDCKTTKPIPGSVEEAEQAAAVTDEKCEKCGKPMVTKRGRFGTFLGCSGYPDCKNIKKVEKKTGVKCNLCAEGEFVAKRGKRGVFYGCNKYPECKNILPTKPTGELCPDCKAPLVFGAKGMVKCAAKGCGFKREAPETETEN